MIELHNGLVIDTYTVSNYCVKCDGKPDLEEPSNDQWCTAHKVQCTNNLYGSAVAMEVEAAKVFFGRSVEKHKLMYKICLCDGDA